jgi:hypothetical protein
MQLAGQTAGEQQVEAAAAAGKGSSSKVLRAAPKLSCFTKFVDLQEWYDKPGEDGRSLRELEEANDTSWRAGANNRKRWSEQKQLLKCIEQRQVEETAKQHRPVTAQQAAQLLDADWQAELVGSSRAQGSNLSTYHRKHIRGGDRRRPAGDIDEQMTDAGSVQAGVAGDDDSGGGEEEDGLLQLAEQVAAAPLPPPPTAAAAAAAAAARRAAAAALAQPTTAAPTAVVTSAAAVPPAAAAPTTTSQAAVAAPASAARSRKQQRGAASRMAAAELDMPFPKRQRTKSHARGGQGKQPPAWLGDAAAMRAAFPEAAAQYDKQQQAAARAAAEAAAIEADHAAMVEQAAAAAVQQGTTQPATAMQQPAGAWQPLRQLKQLWRGAVSHNPAARGSGEGLTLHGVVGGPNVFAAEPRHDWEVDAGDELDVEADVRQQKLGAVGRGM